MSFDPKTALNVVIKSKRCIKKEEYTIKQKIELLYEDILDEPLVNQKSLTKTETDKLFVALSNYLFSKDKISSRLIYSWQTQVNWQSRCFDRESDPTK